MLLTPSGSRPPWPAPTALAVVLAAAACAGPSADAGTRSRPPGSWSAAAAIPAPPGTFSAHDHRVADLRAGPGGALHALFLDDADGDSYPDRLLYAAFDGAAWSPPVALDATPTGTASPRLAVDAAGGVHALWYEGREAARPGLANDLLHRMRAAGGWSDPERLYAPPAAEFPGGALAAAAGADGGVHVVHPRMREGFVDLLGTARGWRGPLPAGRDGGDPRLVAGPGGRMALAEVSTSEIPLLTPEDGSRGDAWVRLFRGERWGEPVPVHPDPAQHSHSPQVAWDGRGVLHLVWMEGEGGSLFPTRLLHSVSPDGRSWSAPRDVAPRGRRVLYSPRLATDGRGAVHLTYARFGDGIAAPRHFHAVLDGGRASPPVEILPELGIRDSELETAVGSDGRVRAVWKGADGVYRVSVLGGNPTAAPGVPPLARARAAAP